jgi:hypothetical protein
MAALLLLTTAARAGGRGAAGCCCCVSRGTAQLPARGVPAGTCGEGCAAAIWCMHAGPFSVVLYAVSYLLEETQFAIQGVTYGQELAVVCSNPSAVAAHTAAAEARRGGYR